MLQKLLGKPWLVAVALAATFALTPGSAKAQHGGGGGGGEGGGTLSAQLVGADDDPFASGQASFRTHGHTQVLEVQVQDVTFSADVLIVVDGNVLAEMSLVDGFGTMELEVETVGGVVYYQPPGSPPIPIQGGSEIDIVDTDTGTLLLDGIFG